MSRKGPEMSTNLKLNFKHFQLTQMLQCATLCILMSLYIQSPTGHQSHSCCAAKPQNFVLNSGADFQDTKYVRHLKQWGRIRFLGLKISLHVNILFVQWWVGTSCNRICLWRCKRWFPQPTRYSNEEPGWCLKVSATWWNSQDFLPRVLGLQVKLYSFSISLYLKWVKTSALPFYSLHDFFQGQRSEVILGELLKIWIKFVFCDITLSSTLKTFLWTEWDNTPPYWASGPLHCLNTWYWIEGLFW